MEGLLAFWIIFAIIVAVAASSRGRSGLGWFLIAVLLSPVLALILVLVLPNLAEDERRQAEARSLADSETLRRNAEARSAPHPQTRSALQILSELGEARDRGLITPDEFEAKKADLLGRL